MMTPNQKVWLQQEQWEIHMLTPDLLMQKPMPIKKVRQPRCWVNPSTKVCLVQMQKMDNVIPRIKLKYQERHPSVGKQKVRLIQNLVHLGQMISHQVVPHPHPAEMLRRLLSKMVRVAIENPNQIISCIKSVININIAITYISVWFTR